jgi:undecaprenyl-diphosphatase
MKRRLFRLLRVFVWLGSHERATLAGLALVASALGGFALLASEVFEGDTAVLDRQILLMFRTPDDLSDPLGPRWLEETMRDFTGLGGMGVLTLITLMLLGFLALQGKPRAMVFILVAVLGGLVTSLLLKELFQRPRPDLVPHGAFVYTASFPSGHSMMAATAYLTLGALLARVQRRLRIRAYILMSATILTGLVGISRVYLGVHWPTDVVGGWAVGAAWALLCSTIALRLQRSGKVEPPTAGSLA